MSKKKENGKKERSRRRRRKVSYTNSIRWKWATIQFRFKKCFLFFPLFLPLKMIQMQFCYKTTLFLKKKKKKAIFFILCYTSIAKSNISIITILFHILAPSIKWWFFFSICNQSISYYFHTKEKKTMLWYIRIWYAITGFDMIRYDNVKFYAVRSWFC